jgi:hypothetical protein
MKWSYGTNLVCDYPLPLAPSLMQQTGAVTVIARSGSDYEYWLLVLLLVLIINNSIILCMWCPYDSTTIYYQCYYYDCINMRFPYGQYFLEPFLRI